MRHTRGNDDALARLCKAAGVDEKRGLRHRVRVPLAS